jgi:hypothetical protein
MLTSGFSRATRPFLAVAFLGAVGVLLALAGAARAERPGFYSAPYVAEGAKAVGSTLVASDGSVRCEPKCSPTDNSQPGPNPEYVGRFFQWIVCNGPHGGGKQGPPGGLPDEGGPCPGAAIVKAKTRIDSDPNANRYIVRPEDAGKYIQVEVIAVNYDCSQPIYHGPDAGKQDCRYSEGHGWSTTFGPIGGSLQPPPPPPPPPAVAPTYAALPTITGEPEDMQTLTVANGTWNGTAPLTYAYQWLRCSKANGGCKPIDGATEAAYTVTGTDIAAKLTAQVTVSNAGGQFVAVAPLTKKIVGAKPRPDHDSLAVSQLAPRNKLRVQTATVAPARLRQGKTWTARVTVTDNRGFLIAGVEVDVEDELGDVTAPTTLTNDRGLATLKLKTTKFVPLGKLVLTVTAAKPVDESSVESQSVTKRIAVKVVR